MTNDNEQQNGTAAETVISERSSDSSFPPDPDGTDADHEQEQNLDRADPVSFPAAVSALNFPPPAANFPLPLKVLHLLLHNNDNRGRKENITCRLQSPSAVAKGHSGFVVEHQDGPFNQTDNVFADHRFRDLKCRSQASVVETQTKYSEIDPPLPMNTIRLFRLSSDQLQFDPQSTIKLANKLHKLGLITEPETSATAYPEGFPGKGKDFVSSVILLLDELCGEEARLKAQDVLANFRRPTRRYSSDSNTLPIHPLLIDTNDQKFKKALNEDDNARKLYELVCRYFLATCMKPGKLAEKSIKFSVGPESFICRKHSIDVFGFLSVAPWLEPKYANLELPSEAKNAHFSKQSFLVSDVIRQPWDAPKGGLSESELILQIELMGMGTYKTIPKTMTLLLKEKLVNIIGPGRWIIPSSEAFQFLELYQNNLNEEFVSASDDSNEMQEEADRTDSSDIGDYSRKSPADSPVHSRRSRTRRPPTPETEFAKKHVRFTLPIYSRIHTRAMSVPSRKRHIEENRNFGAHSHRSRSRSPSPKRRYYRSNQERALQHERERDYRHRPYTRASENENRSLKRMGGRFSTKNRTTVHERECSSLKGTQLFVGNFPSNCDSKTLFNVFREFGFIKDFKFFAQKRSASIEFEWPNEAAEAILKMNGSLLGGSILAVSYHKTGWTKPPPHPTPQQQFIPQSPSKWASPQQKLTPPLQQHQQWQRLANNSRPPADPRPRTPAAMFSPTHQQTPNNNGNPQRFGFSHPAVVAPKIDYSPENPLAGAFASPPSHAILRRKISVPANRQVTINTHSPNTNQKSENWRHSVTVMSPRQTPPQPAGQIHPMRQQMIRQQPSQSPRGPSPQFERRRSVRIAERVVNGAGGCRRRY